MIYQSISNKDLEYLLEYNNVDLIDIRDPYEYRLGHIKQARNIPMDKLIINEKKYLSKSNVYFLICHSGSKSALLCEYLTSLGYQVINVEGGIINWPYPLEK